MKILLTFSILVISSFEIFSQTETYSNKTSSNIQLCLYFDTRKFQLLEYFEGAGEDTIDANFYLEGTIESDAEDEIIICKNKAIYYNYKNKLTTKANKEEYFTFRRVNKHLVINNNMPYIGDSLYVINRYNSHERFSARWKNGKKDGYWRIWKDKRLYLEEYKDGKLISKKKIE